MSYPIEVLICVGVVMFGKKKLIGLDIGTSSVKLAELDVSSRQVILNSFSMVPTPPAAMVHGAIAEGELIADVVRQAFADLKSKRKLVAAGIWGSSVVVKRIVMPSMEENLVSEQIRWEAEQYIPFDINEVNIDYKILEPSGTVGDDNMEILLVAAMQESIFKLAEAVEMSGLSCRILDVEGFALANCFEKNYGGVPQSGPIGLFNIGSTTTNFVVIENGQVVFSRDMLIGGAAYTSALHRAMGISMEEAESIKMSASMGQATPDEAISVIGSTHEVVLEELRSAMEFFANMGTGSQELKESYISGGGSRTLGLESYMKDAYGAVRLNPFNHIKCGKALGVDMVEQARDFGAIAIGLGLRELGDTT